MTNPQEAVSDGELSLSRIVDRSESLDDWARLEQVANRDSTLWRELALMLRDDCQARLAIEARIEPVAHVVIPAVPDSPLAITASTRSWLLGAAAVFVFALGWLFGRPVDPRPATTDPAQMFADYLRTGTETGRIVEQLPSVTLEVRPAANNKLEVIFVRRVIERATIEEAWQVGSDEHGTPRPARVDLASHRPSSSF